MKKGIVLILLGIVLFVFSKFITLLCTPPKACDWWDLGCQLASGIAWVGYAGCITMTSIIGFLIFWIAVFILLLGILLIIFGGKKK